MSRIIVFSLLLACTACKRSHAPHPAPGAASALVEEAAPAPLVEQVTAPLASAETLEPYSKLAPDAASKEENVLNAARYKACQRGASYKCLHAMLSREAFGKVQGRDNPSAMQHESCEIALVYLALGHVARAAARFADDFPPMDYDFPDCLYARGLLEWKRGRPRKAQPYLVQASFGQPKAEALLREAKLCPYAAVPLRGEVFAGWESLWPVLRPNTPFPGANFVKELRLYGPEATCAKGCVVPSDEYGSPPLLVAVRSDKRLVLFRNAVYEVGGMNAGGVTSHEVTEEGYYLDEFVGLDPVEYDCDKLGGCTTGYPSMEDATGGEFYRRLIVLDRADATLAYRIDVAGKLEENPGKKGLRLPAMPRIRLTDAELRIEEEHCGALVAFATPQGTGNSPPKF